MARVPAGPSTGRPPKPPRRSWSSCSPTGWARTSTSRAASPGSSSSNAAAASRAIVTRSARAVPTRARAGRSARPRRPGGGRGPGARRHLPRGRARGGLVPRRGDRSRRVRAGGDLAGACRSSLCVGRIAPGCVRDAGRTRAAAACDCAEKRPELALRGAGRALRAEWRRGADGGSQGKTSKSKRDKRRTHDALGPAPAQPSARSAASRRCPTASARTAAPTGAARSSETDEE